MVFVASLLQLLFTITNTTSEKPNGTMFFTTPRRESRRQTLRTRETTTYLFASFERQVGDYLSFILHPSFFLFLHLQTSLASLFLREVSFAAVFIPATTMGRETLVICLRYTAFRILRKSSQHTTASASSTSFNESTVSYYKTACITNQRGSAKTRNPSFPEVNVRVLELLDLFLLLPLVLRVQQSLVHIGR